MTIRHNVVGYVALFCFALGGTATALPGKNQIDSGGIKNADVTALNWPTPGTSRTTTGPAGVSEAGDSSPCTPNVAERRPQRGFRDVRCTQRG